MALLAFASIANAGELTRSGAGGGFDAVTELLGPAGWIASGKSVAQGDIAQMYQGPSTLRGIRGDAIMTTYVQPFTNIDGLDLGSIDVATHRIPYVNLGFSYSQLRVAGIREASTTALTGNFFDAHQDAARFSIAPRRGGRFGYGAQLTYFSTSIRERSKTRFGVDLGTDYSTDSARIIVNIRNLSTDRGDADALLLMGEIRGEWSPYNELHLGGALSLRENGEGNFQLGAQYDIYKLISIASGYTSASRQWTAGGAVHYNGLSLQYSIAGHSELDFTHTVSLGVEF